MPASPLVRSQLGVYLAAGATFAYAIVDILADFRELLRQRYGIDHLTLQPEIATPELGVPRAEEPARAQRAPCLSRAKA